MQLQQIQTEDGQVVEQLVFEQIPITHIITTDQLQETEHVKVKVKAKEPRQPSIKPPVGKVWRLVIKNIAEWNTVIWLSEYWYQIKALL